MTVNILIKTTALTAVVCLFTACKSVDFNVEKTPSSAMPISADTNLGKFALDWTQSSNGQSAFLPLPNASDALGARLELAARAEKTLDVQYFLMKPDKAGGLIAQAMLDAADRGVRVRFLLDDIFTTTKDSALHTLDQHPNIEVRIFNPIRREGFYWLNYLGTFKETNRRMHNKSYTADTAVTVIGGRNIADSYFALENSALYADYDIVAAGQVATDISESFDRYWNFERTVPIDQLKKNAKYELDEVRRKKGKELEAQYEAHYTAALDSTVLKNAEVGQGYIPGQAELFEDEPEKIINPKGPEYMKLLESLIPEIEKVEEQVIIISPYFIPGDKGVELLTGLAQKGRRIVVVTNSLATNNHTSSQSAYEKYRKVLLRGGVELYELRASAIEEFTDTSTGPDALTMHTKLMFLDHDKLFVGSLNLDPRSFAINTESGLFVESQPLVTSMLRGFEETLPRATYRLELTDKNKLEWHGLINGEAVVKKRQPETSIFKRIGARILRLAPEGQL